MTLAFGTRLGRHLSAQRNSLIGSEECVLPLGSVREIGGGRESYGRDSYGWYTKR